jgi:hypothetical protein
MERFGYLQPAVGYDADFRFFVAKATIVCLITGRQWRPHSTLSGHITVDRLALECCRLS